MKTKRLFWGLSILFVIISMPVNAKEMLTIWLKKGTPVSISLDTMPTTYFEDGNLIIKSSQITASYPISDVVRYTYDLDTSIEKNSIKHTLIKFDGNNLVINNIEKDTEVMVYNAAGEKINTDHITSQSDVLLIPIGDKKGVYIIKIGKATYKIIK